ncbi:Ycf51 family protein [Egbenema bharatensis]|uniref:Ycf51 family protein n=1 Tax=Egbenema bharatensis TaxID=3463334 RepID=UPI003A85B504
MLTTDAFLTYAQWAGITTIAFGLIAVLGFLFKWGIRFRLVGATGFLLVLTAGLFALGIVPFTRTVIPGAVRFTTVFDSGATQAVIVVPPAITESELTATLKQAASDLYSYGRLGGQSNEMLTIRARTIIHPEPGLSQPLYLGQVKRSLVNREDEQMDIEIFQNNLAKLPKSAES